MKAFAIFFAIGFYLGSTWTAFDYAMNYYGFNRTFGTLCFIILTAPIPYFFLYLPYLSEQSNEAARVFPLFTLASLLMIFLWCVMLYEVIREQFHAWEARNFVGVKRETTALTLLREWNSRNIQTIGYVVLISVVIGWYFFIYD